MLHRRLPIVGSRCRSRRVKPQHQQNINTLFVSYCWPWSVLTCADSEVLPQKHPWKGLGWGHQVHSSTVVIMMVNKLKLFRAALPPTLSYSSSWLSYRRGKVAGYASNWVGSFSSYFLLADIWPFLSSTRCMQSAKANWKSRSDLVTVWTITCQHCGQGVRGSGSLWEIWSLTNPLCHLWKT